MYCRYPLSLARLSWLRRSDLQLFVIVHLCAFVSAILHQALTRWGIEGNDGNLPSNDTTREPNLRHHHPTQTQKPSDEASNDFPGNLLLPTLFHHQYWRYHFSTAIANSCKYYCTKERTLNLTSIPAPEELKGVSTARRRPLILTISADTSSFHPLYLGRLGDSSVPFRVWIYLDSLPKFFQV